MLTNSPTTIQHQNDARVHAAKMKAFLSLIHDFLLDESIATSLDGALHNQEPLDIMRMLAHQWNRGLSTLIGDHYSEHSSFLPISATTQFVTALENMLEKNEDLAHTFLYSTGNASEFSKNIYENLSRNKPLRAAWYAALLWERKSELAIQ